jgi:hypothetical protein
MATDVKLDQGDGSFVVVEGRVLKVIGSDLILDSPGRRKETQTPNRRALVHDSGDGLTVNFNGDYPGGVTIHGNAAVTGDLSLSGTAVKSALESIRIDLESNTRTSSSRIDLLEATVASLVDLIGASVIPPWKTKTEVEQGDDEAALGGGPATLSAEALGLIVDFAFDRQDPGFQHEDVVSIEPVAGTAVKRGSTVKVTVNLEG